MTQTVGEIADRINSAFMLEKAAGWDPVGLQVGDPAAAANRVGVCHEVTTEVVDRLIEAGVDLGVTYHPLLFTPTTRVVAGANASGRAYRLIRAGISLVAVHTAFDVTPGGAADSLAAALDLSEIERFGPLWGRETAKIVTFAPEEVVDDIVAAMAGAGAGRIGDYSYCSFRASGTGTFLPGEYSNPVTGDPNALNAEPETKVEMVALRVNVDRVVSALIRAHPYEEPAFDVVSVESNAGFIGRKGTLAAPTSLHEFGALVASVLGGPLRTAGTGTVSTVAVIPGSGGSLLGQVDADVVVTGDVSHHQARDAVARGLRVIDPGHAATERPGVKALYASVAKMISDVVDLTDVDADPWKEG